MVSGMSPAEFKAKWERFSGNESSAYQEHFNDLCRMLRLRTPIEEDPTGSDSFCFQKRVAKDAELFIFDDSGHIAPIRGSKNGFADVWKRDCFGWEYKAPGEDLEKAYKQLLRYRESLLNPPLLVVCDFKRLIVRTNFNGAIQETYEFTNAQLDSPDALRVLRAVFADPGQLRPKTTTEDVTKKLARQIAAVAVSLQKRESVELADAKTRKEYHAAQEKNLRVARFLNRLVFCLFAENTGLLPSNIFSEICHSCADDPLGFAEALEGLFRCMAKGGRFGPHKIRYFNGRLFKDATVFELASDEIRALADASEHDWQNIEPSIMGTLFERGLNPSQRTPLGAHHTNEDDIKMLVEPVLMTPLRREWSALKRDLSLALLKGKGTVAQRKKLADFQDKLSKVTVLDPACGSGNFLYVSLQLLLGLEKEVISAAAQLGDFTFVPKVSVQQLRAIEIDQYAFELAQVSVQIGYLQWRRNNGFTNDRTPVLQNLTGFENKDALLNSTFRMSLKPELEEEHEERDETLKVYNERDWPECDVIVGNPPFLGDKLMRRELGDGYVDELRRNYSNYIPGQSDLCCYWFEKARQQIEKGKCKRVGFLATQGIRGGANREVLKRIKKTGDIFFAESDRPWVLEGANVHVSMIGFDNGEEMLHRLDGSNVSQISANLTAVADCANFRRLTQNEGIGFIGVAQKGPFDLSEQCVAAMLPAPNPHGRPNSDVLVPICNAKDITRRYRRTWNVDFGLDRTLRESQRYEAPFCWIQKTVYPLRIAHREARQTKYWWLFARPCPDMRSALRGLPRFLATPRVSKHRVFVWLASEVLCDSAVVAFARDDDFSFGVLQSRIHEVWAFMQGTQLREKESGFRYTPTTCFDTFPFPRTTPKQENEIAGAAKELNELRERWLNPPEWTRTRIMEFPGSVCGPWARYVSKGTVNLKTGIGTVRYPRLEPRDAVFADRLKQRTLTNLYNERPAWLDMAHRKLDAAVCAAYGFPSNLEDQEILEKLLKLNLERAVEEVTPSFSGQAKTSCASKIDNKLRAIFQKAKTARSGKQIKTMLSGRVTSRPRRANRSSGKTTKQIRKGSRFSSIAR